MNSDHTLQHTDDDVLITPLEIHIMVQIANFTQRCERIDTLLSTYQHKDQGDDRVPDEGQQLSLKHHQIHRNGRAADDHELYFRK